MEYGTRRLVDRSFTGLGLFAIALMCAALATLLAPIVIRGAGAFLFRATIEHRRFLSERENRGGGEALAGQKAAVEKARRPVYESLKAFEAELEAGPRARRREYRKPLSEFKETLQELFGPSPGEPVPVMPRDQYGATRWDRALIRAHDLLYIEEWDYSDQSQMGVKVERRRAEDFAGTLLEPTFAYIESNLDAMMRPKWTFYWGFLTDASLDSYMFGGIRAALLGTLYLTLGAMLIAGPMGVLAAVYFVEYARPSRRVSFLRTCISTLAGVPSIVFGLFGLAFFINTIGVSQSKSVLAGSLTLALLVLPTVIRASEEAIRAVPDTYREAALGLGAGKWRSILTVILPAATPGILTGIIISMGRAAGETAPIIFTAAVTLGATLKPWEVLTQPTPALPWNIYNLCTEHEAVDEIRHVQYGMVLTLVALVLALNAAAVILRARVARKLKG